MPITLSDINTERPPLDRDMLQWLKSSYLHFDVLKKLEDGNRRETQTLMLEFAARSVDCAHILKGAIRVKPEVESPLMALCSTYNQYLLGEVGWHEVETWQQSLVQGAGERTGAMIATRIYDTLDRLNKMALEKYMHTPGEQEPYQFGAARYSSATPSGVTRSGR